MSSEEKSKPEIKKIELTRKWVESVAKLDLCDPIKEKIGREACAPDIVVTPCAPAISEPGPCFPDDPCWPDVCFPHNDKFITRRDIGVCIPIWQECYPHCYPYCSPANECIPDKICRPIFEICIPNRICPPNICKPTWVMEREPMMKQTCGPVVELPVDRLEEISKIVKELKTEIAEIKKKVQR